MSDTVTLPSDRTANNALARRGQATEIESSRAVAEVKAMVVVAQQCPRDVQAAIGAMRESCAQHTLAQRAFFRFPRAGTTVQGPSIHLARELARVWGNITYGISELRRDDDEGVSEMQAYAWDIQTNTRTASIFMVPHMRDTKKGAQKLTDMRDIYESNANAGARRVREAIFAVLPPWFIEEAKDLCTQTLANGGGKPLAQRVADAVKWFESAGVRLSQLEEKVGRKGAEWDGMDLARLEVISKSLRNGEVSLDEEFTAPRVSAEEITRPKAKTRPSSEAPKEEDTPQTGDGAESHTSTAEASPAPQPAAPSPEPITKPQLTKLHILLEENGMGEREAGLAFLSKQVGRELTSSKDLTKAEASRIIDAESPAPLEEPPLEGS